MFGCCVGTTIWRLRSSLPQHLQSRLQYGRLACQEVRPLYDCCRPTLILFHLEKFSLKKIVDIDEDSEITGLAWASDVPDVIIFSELERGLRFSCSMLHKSSTSLTLYYSFIHALTQTSFRGAPFLTRMYEFRTLFVNLIPFWNPGWILATRSGTLSKSPSRPVVCTHNLQTGFTLYSLVSRHVTLSLPHETGENVSLPSIFIHNGYAIAGATSAGIVRLWNTNTGE